MSRISGERKEAILKKLLPPYSMSVSQLAKEEGISTATLYYWRQQLRESGVAEPNSHTSSEQCFNQPIVLHSDNGAPMKSLTFKAKMEELGIISSYSRPRVSDDNPYIESLFRTVKYIPTWPTKGFEHLKSSRNWVEAFVSWYNTEHKHSQLNYVTPSQRHNGKDKAILAHRAEVLLAAKQRHPERWSRDIRNCKPVGEVYLNPEKEAA